MREKYTIIFGILSIILLTISFTPVPNASLPVAPEDAASETNRELDLINKSKTLSAQSEFADYVFSGEVIDIICYRDGKGRILTEATIKIDKVLKGSISTKTISIKYTGGTVEGKIQLTFHNWQAGDYPLPGTFELKKGDKIIAFTDKDYFIEVYIANPIMPSQQSVISKHVIEENVILSQGTQPTTAVYENQGYAFNWSAKIRYTWSDLPIYFNIDPDGTSDIAGTAELNEIRTAFNTWENDYFSGIDYYDNGTNYHLTNDNYDSEIYLNVIGWLNLGGSEGLAITNIFGDSDTGFYHMTEFHVCFDDYWTWCIGSTANQYDVQNTAAHEVGHTLCLLDLYSGSNSEQTMYWSIATGETKKRTLEYGDMNGVHYLYPIENDGPTGTDAGNSFDTANTVNKNYYYKARLCCFPTHNDTQDWYKISLGASQRIIFRMTPPSWANFDLELYAPNGTLVAYSRSPTNGQTESIVMDPMGVTGYWRLRVYAPSCAPIVGSGNYTFVILDLPPFLLEPPE
jgi:hypothetical protein